MIKPDCSNPQLLVNEAALNLLYNGGVLKLFGEKMHINRSNLHNISKAFFFKAIKDKKEDELDMCFVQRDDIVEPLYMYVACRKCPICKQKRQFDLIFRADMESSLYDCPPYFFTLTYAPEYLPYHSELIYSDFQKFLKRLRINWTRQGLKHDIRYLVAGEYGSKSRLHRPHFHFIMWNNPYHCDELMPLQHKKLGIDVFRAWNKCKWQSFDFGQCKGGAAAYATKYVTKESQSYGRFHKPFIRMSTGKGGIGSRVIKDNQRYFDENLFCNEITYRKFDGELGRVAVGSYASQKLFPSPTRSVNATAKRLFKQITDCSVMLVRLGYWSLTDARLFLEEVTPLKGFGRVRIGRYDVPPLLICSTARKFYVFRYRDVISSLLEDLPDISLDGNRVRLFYERRQFYVDREQFDKAFKLLQVRTRVGQQVDREVF